jgi:SnoaL-like domain
LSNDRLAALEHRLQVLEDERAITRLIASYGPLVDAGDADAVAALWAVDGSYDVGDWKMGSRDEIAAMVKSDAHQGLMARGCCHFFGPPVVTVDEDNARAVCQSTILVRREAGGYHVMRAGVHLILLRRESHGWAIVSRVARQLDGSGTAFDLVATGLKGNTK